MAGQDRPDPAPGAPDPAVAAHDPTRREFFRTFSRQTVRQAGAVAGAAAELRRSTLSAARVLFDPEESSPIAPVVPVNETAVESTFRSAYRFTGDELIVLDARQLPGRVATLSLLEPSEVASAIRTGAINSGPVLAEVGAYAMAMAARKALDRPQVGRHQQMRAAAGALRAARREVRALGWAIDRMEMRYDELAAAATEPQALADSLRAEADAIASTAAETHAAIGRLGARQIPPPPESPLNLLVHGDMGPLSCGMVGMGTALIQALSDAGLEVHVWLAEAAPSEEGGRLSAAQLRQFEVPHTVVPDSALGWLFDQRRIDALLLRGDRIAANGDCGVLIGGLGAALLAAAAGVPVHVLAPLISVDRIAVDGAAVRGGTSIAAGPGRLNPTNDAVPAGLIASFFTEAGVLKPPFATALSRALAKAL